MTSTGSLRELDAGLWVVDAPLSVFGFQIGTRMTLIRLADGGLFVHSPSPLDAHLQAEIEALGPVRCVVAPSKIHFFYVAEHRQAFPQARFFAAPGLPEKRPELAFDEVLGPGPPAEWAGELEQTLFGGVDYVNEVVFFHPATRTLVLTDMAFNVQQADNLWSQLFFRLNDAYRRFGPSRMMRRLIRDRAAARESLQRILRWDFERVIVTHGIVLQHAGKRMLRDAYAFLLDDAPEAAP